MNKKNEIYKNAPLVETVFEVRFPGEPSVECGRDKFYEKIRSVYSKVMIPRVFEGRALALDPYKFEQENGSSGVMVSINKMSFFCKKYFGFESFKKEAMKIYAIFGDLFKIKKLSRTGLRYINVIPFTRENDIIPIKNYLNVKIDLPKSIPTDFKNLNIIFVSQTTGGSITTRIEPALSQDRTQEIVILDFDYAKEGDLKFADIDKYLEESHQHTKYLFEELVTEEYRKVMRGEVI